MDRRNLLFMLVMRKQTHAISFQGHYSYLPQYILDRWTVVAVRLISNELLRTPIVSRSVQLLHLFGHYCRVYSNYFVPEFRSSEQSLNVPFLLFSHLCSNNPSLTLLGNRCGLADVQIFHYVHLLHSLKK